MSFIEAKHPCRQNRSCFGRDGCLGHTSNTSSSDEEPSSTNSTLASGIDTCAYPDALTMLTDHFDTSTNSIVCEGEAIADLILSLSSHFRRYNQLFVGMQSTLHELAKRCSERSRESEQRPLDMQLLTSDPNRTTKQSSVCGLTQALPGLAKQTTPYSFPGHKNKRTVVTAPAAKRPLSDFNFFCRDARKLVVEAHPEYTKEQVNKELGRIWSSLDGGSRQHYRQMYVQDKQRYSQDVSALAEKSRCAIGSTGMAGNVQPMEATGGGAIATSRVHGPGANDRTRHTIWKYTTAHATAAGGTTVHGLSIDPEPVPELKNGMGGKDINSLSGAHTEYSSRENSRSRGCRKSRKPGNTLQSILNASPSTQSTVDDPEDVDEPLAHTLPLLQPASGLLAADRRHTSNADIAQGCD
ncbi:high mobility group [Coemansia sp. RSA 1813]|nr:High mobility group box 1 [Coemansia sp. RSA 1646]KAJ1771108.1 high mobility group [Coemansia sp. RSA 1843]KAJ2088501.1 high mobility group [Coemansia sp. RSA 986]KAJ2217095.1 high mobility group [Coemansia sp. RSA 487]KAJ2568268.1 high mobility group [Coemansia sp. RSA 1813]